MKRKLIGIIAVFALSLLVGGNVNAVEVFRDADVELPVVTVTCSKECSGDTGGISEQMTSNSYRYCLS